MLCYSKTYQETVEFIKKINNVLNRVLMSDQMQRVSARIG